MMIRFFTVRFWIFEQKVGFHYGMDKGEFTDAVFGFTVGKQMAFKQIGLLNASV